MARSGGWDSGLASKPGAGCRDEVLLRELAVPFLGPVCPFLWVWRDRVGETPPEAQTPIQPSSHQPGEPTGVFLGLFPHLQNGHDSVVSFSPEEALSRSNETKHRFL